MTIEADVVVIGSGVAGALCAWKLAQQNLKVLIIEAGPRLSRADVMRAFASTHNLDVISGFPNAPWAPRPDWSSGKDNYVRQTGRDIVDLNYIRALGGTTWHWTGGCDRLLPADLKLQSTYGVGVDWPIDYRDLAPFYDEAEIEIGVAGDNDLDQGSPRSARYPLPKVPPSHLDKVISEKLNDLKISVTARPSARNTLPYDGRPQCEGFGTCSPICPTGAQYSAMVHIEKAERLGARVLTECRVDRIKADVTGQISEVELRRSDGSFETAKGKIFVLAANGMESPRLLLASANETLPNGVANSSDQVGRNYMDHFGLDVTIESSHRLYPNRGPVFTSCITDFRDGPARASESAFFITLYNKVVLLSEVTDEFLRANLLPPALDESIRDRFSRMCVFEAFTEELPSPENRLTIDWSDRDSAGQPRICLNFARSDYAKRGSRSAVTLLNKLGEQLGSRRTVVSEPHSRDHIMGTLRMGLDARTSVVDRECRAHDHPNLFVAGSAVFPTSGAGSPTLTIAALSLRIARTIARLVN